MVRSERSERLEARATGTCWLTISARRLLRATRRIATRCSSVRLVSMSRKGSSHHRSDQQGAIVGDTVGLAPDAHGAGLGQGAVGGAEQRLAVERHLEALVGRDPPQRMPLVGLDRCFLAADLAALALFHAVEAHRVV